MVELPIHSHRRIEEIIIEFKDNFDKVSDFMRVDEELFEVISIQLKSIEKLDNNVVAAKKIKAVIGSLNTIRINGTIPKKLAVIYNQSVVLMASYFSHALDQMFSALINEQYKRSIPEDVLKEELKISLNDISDMEFDLSETIGKMIIKKEDLKFQDMNSTRRAFGKYLNIQLQKGKETNNIIVALALRHAMVHNGGKISEKTIDQTKHAEPRDIQSSLIVGQEIFITQDEIHCIGDCMLRYLNIIVEKYKTHNNSEIIEKE